MFLGLAYDARKAYEQQREVLQPPQHCEAMGVRYGVKILWPVLLLQHRMLRLSLAFLSHSAKTQAIAYALEAIIEEALREGFGAQAGSVIALWRRPDPAQPKVLKCSGAVARFFLPGPRCSGRRISCSYWQVSIRCVRATTPSVSKEAKRVFSLRDSLPYGTTWNGPIQVGSYPIGSIGRLTSRQGLCPSPPLPAL